VLWEVKAGPAPLAAPIVLLLFTLPYLMLTWTN